METKSMTRRTVLKVSAAGAVIAVVPGCGVVQAAATVIVNVPWASVLKVVSAVLILAQSLLTITAQIENGETATIDSQLTTEQAEQLGNGGTLILQTRDGLEIRAPFTVR